MDFFENRYLHYEHLLSYSTRVEAAKLLDMLEFANRNIDALELKASGNTIFRIVEVIPSEKGEIYGVEILIPTDKAFVTRGQCVYKPVIKICNAVSYMFCNINEIFDAETNIYGYMRRRNMKPITDVYFVLKQKSLIEAYVGISSNIL